MPVLASFQPGNVATPAQSMGEGAQVVSGLMSRASQLKSAEQDRAAQRQEMQQRSWQFNMLKPVVEAKAQASLGTDLAKVKDLEFRAQQQALAAPRFLESNNMFKTVSDMWDEADQTTDPAERQRRIVEARNETENWLGNYQHFGDLPGEFQGSYQLNAKQLSARLSSNAALDTHRKQRAATDEQERMNELALAQQRFKILSDLHGKPVKPDEPISVGDGTYGVSYDIRGNRSIVRLVAPPINAGRGAAYLQLQDGVRELRALGTEDAIRQADQLDAILNKAGRDTRETVDADRAEIAKWAGIKPATATGTAPAGKPAAAPPQERNPFTPPPGTPTGATSPVQPATVDFSKIDFTK